MTPKGSSPEEDIPFFTKGIQAELTIPRPEGRLAVFGLSYGLTVTVAAFEVTPPAVAVTVAVPTETAVTSPAEDMAATELGVHVQVALPETLAMEPFA